MGAAGNQKSELFFAANRSEMENRVKNRGKLVLVLTFLGISACGILKFKEKQRIEKQRSKQEISKNYKMFQLMNQWINVKIRGGKIETYLNERNYRKVAIYGMSYIGQTLINDLRESNVQICFGVDKDAEVYWDEFPIIRPEDISDKMAEEADVMIVSAFLYMDEIKRELDARIKCPILSLEEVIQSI